MQASRVFRHPPSTPFLRWAGGKQLLLSKLLPYVVEDYATRVYYEPFLGAGALFFSLRPPRAHLSDANKCLVECYNSLRANCNRVAQAVDRLRRQDSVLHYYQTRLRYNRDLRRATATQAARFIYLNRTCFNGIFRVNRSGEFNVPYGHKIEPAFPSFAALLEASRALRNACVTHRDYKTALAEAKRGYFVYLDPPYPPLNGTSYFTHYTAERFGATDQEQLAVAARAADSRGCLFMMTNADTAEIRRLYRGYRIEKLNATRYVTCKERKHKVSELVIRNY